MKNHSINNLNNLLKTWIGATIDPAVGSLSQLDDQMVWFISEVPARQRSDSHFSWILETAK